MQLINRYEENNKEYYCDFTKELDDFCGCAVKFARYKHYILDTRDLWENYLAIRVPGRTVGGIKIDSNKLIIGIELSNELIGENKLYPQNVGDMLKKYIGVGIILNQ